MGRKLLVLAAVLLVATTGVAHAQNYPLIEVDVNVGGQLIPGGGINARAKVYRNGTEVSFFFGDDNFPLGTALASSGGVANLATTIPLSASPGQTYTVKATGLDANGVLQTATTTITLKLVGQSAGDAQVAGISIERPAGSSNSTDGLLPRLGLGAFACAGLGALAMKRRAAKAPADRVGV